MSTVVPIDRGRKQRNPRSWEAMRWKWLEDVSADPDLSQIAKLVAHVLVCQFANGETAECMPGADTIGARMAASGDSVKRALRALEEGGWIMRDEGRGRGRMQRIRFQFLASEKGGKTAGFSSEKGGESAVFSEEKRGQFCAEKGAEVHFPPTPPYKDKPTSNQSRAPEPVREASSDAAIGQCPIQRFEEVTPGSRQHALWDAWLAERGYLPLSLIGLRRERAESSPWFMPTRSPPDPGLPWAVNAAVKFAEWLMRRHAQTTPSAERTHGDE